MTAGNCYIGILNLSSVIANIQSSGMQYIGIQHIRILLSYSAQGCSI